MTKFEQLMLRAMRAQLLMQIARYRSIDPAVASAHNVVADIEYALTAGAIDERDEMHG